MSTQKLPNHCQHKKQKLYLSTQNQKLNLSTQRYLNHCQHKNDQITDRNKDQCYTKHHPCQHNNYQITVNTNVTRSLDLTFTSGQKVDVCNQLTLRYWLVLCKEHLFLGPMGL